MVRNRSLITVSRELCATDLNWYVINSWPWSLTWVESACIEEMVKKTNTTLRPPRKSTAMISARTPGRHLRTRAAVDLQWVITSEQTSVCLCGNSKKHESYWFACKRKTQCKWRELFWSKLWRELKIWLVRVWKLYVNQWDDRSLINNDWFLSLSEHQVFYMTLSRRASRISFRKISAVKISLITPE